MTVITGSTSAAPAPAALPRSRVWALLAAGLLANLFGIVGGTWDGAYHARYRVDTFWSPPHLLIYSGIAGTLILGMVILAVLVIEGRKWGGGMMRRNPLLLITVLANLGFLATGPFDELWHALFGRDQLTVWTVPHLILNLNLVLTALGVVGLAVWLRAASPRGSLAAGRPAQPSRLSTGVPGLWKTGRPAQPSPPSLPLRGLGGRRLSIPFAPARAQTLAIVVGLSMVLIHVWGFLSELEAGDTSLSPIPALGWLYPLMAVALLSFCLALASQLLPERWWMALPLVVLAQLWWVVPGLVLRQFGYQQVDNFRVSLTLAGLLWALLMWAGRRWPVWLKFAGFGAGYIAVVLIARAAGLLPATGLDDVLLTAPFLPALAVLGGYVGRALGVWVQAMAGDRQRDPSAL